MSGFFDNLLGSRSDERFVNRYDAGRAIAEGMREIVAGMKGKGAAVGLLRGGVAVAKAVANELTIPIDFRSVRKVGHPYHPEFAIGAVDISGVSIRNPMLDPSETVSDEEFERMANRELEHARTLEEQLIKGGAKHVEGCDWCLVIDDGAATGLTLLAAVRGIKSEGLKVLVGLPVSSDHAEMLLRNEADYFYSVHIPRHFMAVSQFYDDFEPVSTEEVRSLLI